MYVLDIVVTKTISELKLDVIGLCDSPVTDEFPAQMASNAESFSIWWRHHGIVAI